MDPRRTTSSVGLSNGLGHRILPLHEKEGTIKCYQLLFAQLTRSSSTWQSNGYIKSSTYKVQLAQGLRP